MRPGQAFRSCDFERGFPDRQHVHQFQTVNDQDALPTQDLAVSVPFDGYTRFPSPRSRDFRLLCTGGGVSGSVSMEDWRFGIAASAGWVHGLMRFPLPFRIEVFDDHLTDPMSVRHGLGMIRVVG